MKALLSDKIPSGYDPYPPPTHAFTVAGKHCILFVTCAEALIGLEEPIDTDELSQKRYSKKQNTWVNIVKGNRKLSLIMLHPLYVLNITVILNIDG